MPVRNLVVVLGDQLDRELSAFDGFDPACDRVWMAEVEEEATHVRQHQQRLVLFFSAMRHFRDQLRREGLTVQYQALSLDAATDRGRSFAEVLAEDVPRLSPQRLILTEPGDWRVLQSFRDAARQLGLALELRADRHFYTGIEEFRHWAEGRGGLVMEAFYRQARRRHGVLMDGGRPVGGRWNFDRQNRRSFGAGGPGRLPRSPSFPADDLTRAVIEMVRTRFADHPGDAAGFDQPVTAAQAATALDVFIAERLSAFGDWQDALWTAEPFLYHSRLSAALNLHLLNPRRAVEAAEQAYRDGAAPINAVEGFVRQILGWREFVRGVYWLEMPGYARRNALQQHEPLPAMFWSGQTDMACLRDALGNVLRHGYAHHIQRLMVLGLFAQLYGADPWQFHQWHMAMYVDAVDWVSLPNALGMSQFADGGVVGTKPYCASGAYLQRMSNHCTGCRYQPKQTEGDRACPITVFYWDFLDRHRERLAGNHRMTFQLRNLDRRREQGGLDDLRRQADWLRRRIAAGKRV
jgi:deoxyribodipyrimidine photolyase-related protein